MTALPQRRYILEEYPDLDKNSEERYEYFDGVPGVSAGEIHRGCLGLADRSSLVAKGLSILRQWIRRHFGVSEDLSVALHGDGQKLSDNETAFDVGPVDFSAACG